MPPATHEVWLLGSLLAPQHRLLTIALPGGPTVSGGAHHPSSTTLHAPHHEKAQGRPPMVTETLLPALRWLPSMAIQVPPERGPRAGTTREKVGVCQRKRASLVLHGLGTKTHSPKQPQEGDRAAEERDLWDSSRAQC